MRQPIAVSLSLLAALGWAGEAPPADDRQTVDGIPVPVWAKKEVNIKVSADPDVASRELWYRNHDGKAWATWQKHGQAFGKEAPIVWTPPEGHWQVYVRKILTSGLSAPEPTSDIKLPPQSQFIIDRTPPTVGIGYPPAKTKLRGGGTYTVRWEANDPHLKATPITIRFSRDGKSAGDVVTSAIGNTGSYEWTVPRDMTTAGVLRIEALDKAGNLGSAEAANLLVDSVKPKGRVVGPAICARPEVPLQLDIADEGPAGLAATHELWVSQDDGANWNIAGAIQDPKQVVWTAKVDGRYRLAVVAKDQAGNQSAQPKGQDEAVQFLLTVDSTAPSVQLTSPIGIIPADSPRPTAQRDFKPGDRVQVQFQVKDANLVTSPVAIYFQEGPDKPWLELAKALPAEQAYRFEVPAKETRTARIKVTATDQAGNVGEVVASEAFTIQTSVTPEEISID